MRRVYVRLAEAEIDQLVRRAARERRHPAEEAGVLLVKALREAEAPARSDREDAVAPPAAEPAA